MSQSILVPSSLLKELYEHLVRVEEVLATLEELMNEEGVERIKKASEEYRKGEYVTVENPEDLEKVL